MISRVICAKSKDKIHGTPRFEPGAEIQKVRLDLGTGGVLSKDRNTLLIHCYNVDDLHSVSPVYMGEELRVQTPFHPQWLLNFRKMIS